MSKCKVLVTGATGLLGRAVFAELQDTFHVVGTGFSRASGAIAKVDLLDKQAITDFVLSEKPQVIIHCAAERRPDAAEKNEDALFKINVGSVETLAYLSKQLSALFMVITTDSVFDGANPPYQVDSPRNPLNLYGKSKVAAEDCSRDVYPDRVILRVPLLYGPAQYIDEFSVSQVLKTVLNPNKQLVDHVTQRHPTSVADVARVIRDLIKKDNQNAALVRGKTFQFSSETRTTKFEMACMMADVLGISKDHLCPQLELPQDGAKRAINPKLSTDSLKAIGIDVSASDLKTDLAKFVPQWKQLVK